MIAIVDYRAGNLTSVEMALREVGAQCVVTSEPERILAADRVIFPGVGAAGSAMAELRRRGLDQALKSFLASGRPMLGICVGTQILLERSEEDGGTECLGILPGSVRRFDFGPGSPFKVPHMGWNQVERLREHPVLSGIPDGADFYFVHSYYPAPERREDALAATEYGGLRFTCMVARDNLVACQFHTEKSGQWGLQLLKNFSTWDGRCG